MNRKDNLEKTKNLARITRILCRITIWAAAIGTAILLITVLVTYLVPPEHLKPLQSDGKLGIFITEGFTVPADIFTSIDALRGFLMTLLARVASGGAIYVIAAIHVMGLLKSVENGEPFAVANVSRLRRISLVMIIGSFVVPSVSSAAAAMASQIDLLDIKGNSMFDLTLLLCGLLVLVLSGVFAYGARLQREHDQTV